MPTDRDHVLARIQRTAQTPGATLEEVDRRVAEELGISVEHYFAYLLVTETIDAHAAIRLPAQLGLPSVDGRRSTPLSRAQDLTDAIGWRAATIYQAAATSGSAGDIGGHAARILGSLLQLRQNLRDLDTLERLADWLPDGQAVTGDA